MKIATRQKLVEFSQEKPK